MDQQVDPTGKQPAQDPPGQWNRRSRKYAAIGLAAGLLGGGAAGMVLSEAPLSGATGAAVGQTEPAEGQGSDGDERRAEHLAEVLAPLVDAGTINQAQADAVTEALLAAAPEHRPGGHRGARPGLEAAAGAIGIDTEALGEALRDGSTIADVAAANGVDVQVVIDAMVAEADEHLSAAVDDGRITEDEASERRDGLTERITDAVNNGGDRGGPDGHRGPPPGGPQPEARDGGAQEDGD